MGMRNGVEVKQAGRWKKVYVWPCSKVFNEIQSLLLEDMSRIRPREHNIWSHSATEHIKPCSKVFNEIQSLLLEDVSRIRPREHNIWSNSATEHIKYVNSASSKDRGKEKK
ncbi:hypothetical protein PoB_004975800 [Plakobranchus ocellatus]|uniref:Uncharacterized protein n=1 Tax=Plakobranchus ocellatus TaxID=259542 RepID=A0AAV4BVL1_9GAST|nr:hypothetical protein PoB_004975800 [Plakobranchus ocellatus]